jgi:hypothetical protein
LAAFFSVFFSVASAFFAVFFTAALTYHAAGQYQAPA